MKSILIQFLLFCSFLSAQNNVNQQIDELLDTEFFKSAQISVSVYDLTNEKDLYLRNEHLLLHPASNMKILTSAAGLEFLGPDYNFNTELSYLGEINDSVLNGNIFIKGGCDPDFTTKDLDSLIKEIKAHGIKEINGNIFGDVSMTDSIFWGKGWMWDDDPSTDFPYMTPLTINDNAVKIIFGPGEIKEPLLVKTEPESDFFQIKNNSQTFVKDSTKLKVTRNWINRKNDILVNGFLPYLNYPDTLRVNLFKPEQYFLHLAAELLKANNIKVTGKFDLMNKPIDAVNIFTFKRTYDDIIDNLNKQSDNLSAEMTLRAMGYKYFGENVSSKNAVKLIDSLITISSEEKPLFRVVDGSGVSHYNLITTDIILNVLKYTYSNKTNYKILKRSFPVAGIDGTLKRRMRETIAESNVHAKTGTLSGVSSLSGYLTDKNGNDIAFSIMVQNYIGSSRTARDFQDKICEILCNLN